MCMLTVLCLGLRACAGELVTSLVCAFLVASYRLEKEMLHTIMDL